MARAVVDSAGDRESVGLFASLSRRSERFGVLTPFSAEGKLKHLIRDSHLLFLGGTTIGFKIWVESGSLPGLHRPTPP